jgi:peptide/nickel transport system permease protein
MAVPNTTNAGQPITVNQRPRARGARSNPWALAWRSVWTAVSYSHLATVGFVLLAIYLVVAIFAPLIAPYDPQQMAVGTIRQGPSVQHWLGTTAVGQDVWSQLIQGTRTSLMVGFTVGILSTVLAVLIGSTAGFLGGWVDDVLTVLMNVFLTIPNLPLTIVAASYAAAFHVRGTGVIVVVLTLTGWAWGARVKRSQILSLRNRDFVTASRLSGENWFRVMVVEILPNMMSLIASTFIFSVIFAVLTEAALEFIGLGDLSATTWGTMLYWSQNSSALLTGMWWWFLPPGIAIGLFALSLTLIQYVLDEMTNPRLRSERTAKSGRSLKLAPTVTRVEPEASAPVDATTA